MEKSQKITAYRLRYSNAQDDIKDFITKDPAEVKIKAMELMQENDILSIAYVKYKTTNEAFIKELQEIIS